MKKAINLTKILSVFLIIFSFSFALSQSNFGSETIINYEFRAKEIKFDHNYEVDRPDPKPFEKSVKMKNSALNSAYFGGVGGISFDQTAQPAGSLKIVSFYLKYNPTNEDGSRLELKINGKDIRVRLPDWILIPVANYSNSPYYSCFTLFGKLQNSELENVVVENAGRVMNYHPAFDNTLLGLRIAYMDMLLVYLFSSDLPKDKTGNYILGNGETAPDVQQNKRGRSDLSQHMIKVERKHGLTSRSYIICDYNQSIVFNINVDSLYVSGYPYYYCWRYKMDEPDYDINSVGLKISEDYQNIIKEKKSINMPFSFQDWVINEMVDAAEKYDGNYNFYEAGDFVELIKIKNREKRKNFLTNYDPQSLFNLLVETEAYMDAKSVIFLQEYSNDLSNKSNLFEASNPAVWKATLNTLRYSAFFRYCKEKFPEEWNKFINQIKDIHPRPLVETPTIFYPSGNTKVEQAIAKE
ncbi:MAG: hypothetical protein KAT48_04580 [Bacteroidales bacterium]|nr:hypothetical protein [Bacteroidales bacterium]